MQDVFPLPNKTRGDKFDLELQDLKKSVKEELPCGTLGKRAHFVEAEDQSVHTGGRADETENLVVDKYFPSGKNQLDFFEFVRNGSAR